MRIALELPQLLRQLPQTFRAAGSLASSLITAMEDR